MTPFPREPADARARRARLVLAACVAVPAVVLVASYLWLAADRGTLALWDVIVHESGRYTLGQTVLYVSHFLREVPTDVAYALFLLAAAGGSGVVAPDDREHRRLGRRLAWMGLGGAVMLVAVALVATARADGWGSALRDLLQFRTRDDLMAYGSHWRYHWLSTVWFGAAVWLAPMVVARATGAPAIRRSLAWERVAWAYVIALTAVFGISPEVFTDTRYAGHQAREILTHGPVTALLGIAVLLAARRRLGFGVESAATGRAPRAWIRIALAVAIPAYLGIAAMSGDVMAAGQSDRGLAAMVAAHYFEHALDYLLVALLVLGGVGVRVARPND